MRCEYSSSLTVTLLLLFVVYGDEASHCTVDGVVGLGSGSAGGSSCGSGSGSGGDSGGVYDNCDGSGYGR